MPAVVSGHDDRPWFQLDPAELIALPTDELGLRILIQMGWSKLIAPDGQNTDDRDGKNTDDRWWLATRLGREVASRADGLARLRAGERVEMDLHPRIADDVRAEFLRGRFVTAAWAAMREVEIPLREAAALIPSSGRTCGGRQPAGRVTHRASVRQVTSAATAPSVARLGRPGT